MATSVQVHSDLAIPPGEYLSEVLADVGMTQADLARRMGRPEQVVSEILNATKRITSESALVDLETYRVLARLGFVAKTRDRSTKVRELWRFFGVASLHNVAHLRTYGAAFRVSSAGGVSPYALAAWLRCGELLATDTPVEPFSASSLRTLLPELRSWTRDPLGAAVPKVRAALAACGVVLVVVPHFPKTRAHGATFWVSADKAVVQMSLRGAWSDVFWFSLFHEIGHVLLHGKKQVFLEGDLHDRPNDGDREDEADAFASERLIPSRALDAFLAAGAPTAARIVSFADQVGVAAGIVVGRLQHRGVLRHDQLNGLRDRHVLSEAGKA